MERTYNEAIFQVVAPKSRLVDRVADKIQRLIVSGQLAPGTRLPPEREFAEQLGVSRPVVREAVHQLIAKGLLESKHGSGTTVREMTRESVVAPLGWLAQSMGATLDHLHAVRVILEGAIVRMAAEQASDEEISELQRIVANMRENTENVEVFVALDAEFHQALAETAHNPLLGVLLDSVRDLMQEVRLEVHRHMAIYATIVPDHEEIIAAVAARNPDAASRAMQRHLDHTHEFQKEFIASRDEIQRR